METLNTLDNYFDEPQSHTPTKQEEIEETKEFVSFDQNNPSFLKPFPNLSKLIAPSYSRKNIILFLFGSFYPIHNNHLRTLEIAKSYIEENSDYNKNFCIMGGFIMPTHFNSLKKKLGKPLLSNETRLDLCEIAISSSHWITLIPTLVMQKTNIGVTKTKKFLTDYVNFHFSKSIKKKNQKISIVSVLGADNLEIVEKNLQKREIFIIVQNRPGQNQKNLDEWIKSEKVFPFKENIIIINDDKVPEEMSSTDIRKILSLPFEDQKNVEKFLPIPVCKYLYDKKIIFPIPTLINEKTKLANPLPNPNFEEISIEKLLGFSFLRIDISELIPLDKPFKLGEGLQGNVIAMKWFHPQLKQIIPVAVKFTELNTDKGRKIKTFIRDLRALLFCNHNNVIHCYGAGSKGETLFTVMERGLGFKTWEFIHEQRKKWENKSQLPVKWFKYLAELAEGLDNMSKSGVLHRDLQLNNVVIFPRVQIPNLDEQILDFNIEDFQLKICDFGVSAIESDKHLIVRGSTRHYAPEALEDKNNYVSASDVYSFGNMLYEIVNGRKIFTEYSVEQMQIKVKMGERPNFIKGADLRLKEIIEKCWEHNLIKRPSFEEISKYIYKIYDNEIKK